MKFTAINKLQPGMVLGQNLIGISQADNYTVGYVLTENDIRFLEDKGLFGLYTIETQPAQILSPELMKKCIRAIRKVDIDAIIPLATQIVDELTTRTTNLDFRSIRSYDDYLPHHSVCVAVYAVATGIQLGMGNSQLQSLALAGLLHDIGQVQQNHSILIKKDQLSPEEYEQVKKHPQDGFDFLTKHGGISSVVREAILHHHENINGTGYPDQQNDESISPLSRILHVVDVYDAIMSKRPYKKGMSSVEAINYLLGGKMILFDERIVDKFLEIAVPYPTGCDVRLSNEEIVTVIGQTEEKLRPLVYCKSKQCIINLATDTDYQDVTVQNDIEYEGTSTEAITKKPTNAIIGTDSRVRKKILIVDDVFVSIAYTKLALGPDYDVVTCLGGAQALKMVITEKPDLILMDYEMPDKDGVTVVNEIHKAGYQIPVIFLTGKCDKETVRKCGHCGAVDYILKPANPVYLQTRVNMALYHIDVNTLI